MDQKPNIEQVYAIFRDFMVAIMAIRNKAPENPEVQKLQDDVHKKLDTIGLGEYIDWTRPTPVPAKPPN